MSAPTPGGDPPAPPATDDLLRIDADAWAALLRHLRSALDGLDDAKGAVATLRDTPTARLAGGRMRREAAAAIAAGGALWSALYRRLRADDQLHARLVRLIEPDDRASEGAPRLDEDQTDRRRVEELKERLREARDERDRARRQADGEAARAQQLETALADAESTIVDLRDVIARHATDLEEARGAVRQAVERESRRWQAEISRLEAELTTLRRREHERRETAERTAHRSTGDTQSAPAVAPPPPAQPRARAGRPSQLPPGVHPETAEAAGWLLRAVRHLIVDGYNVTKAVYGDQPLTVQRDWLVNLLGPAAARYGIEVEVVFDGAATGPGSGVRGLSVRFTPPGITADDEITFAVAALEENVPVLVVTDDRELRERVGAYAADVIGARPFVAAWR